MITVIILCDCYSCKDKETLSPHGLWWVMKMEGYFSVFLKRVEWHTHNNRWPWI